MDARATSETITQQAIDALAGSEVVVDEVTLQRAGRRRLVRIFLARDVRGLPKDDATSPVEPLTLDEVAEATRSVSEALDASDIMGDSPYTLEVSSAGLDRPLGTFDQFRRNVGRLVTVTTTDGGSRTDRLLAARPEAIVLAGASDDPVPLEDVSSAVVQVEFNRRDGEDA